MNVYENFHPDWKPILKCLSRDLMVRFRTEILPVSSHQPSYCDIYRVFQMPPKSIKVVILGEEPCNVYGAANGLAYANRRYMSSELETIYASISKGDERLTESWKELIHWETQGVFLLNMSLTVETGEPESHKKWWKDFTQEVIRFIAKVNPCVWLIWGDSLQYFERFIDRPLRLDKYNEETLSFVPKDRDINYIFREVYPERANKKEFSQSPCFEYANYILQKTKSTEIMW